MDQTSRTAAHGVLDKLNIVSVRGSANIGENQPYSTFGKHITREWTYDTESNIIA